MATLIIDAYRRISGVSIHLVEPNPLELVRSAKTTNHVYVFLRLPVLPQMVSDTAFCQMIFLHWEEAVHGTVCVCTAPRV
jgi:hypothetical protein